MKVKFFHSLLLLALITASVSVSAAASLNQLNPKGYGFSLPEAATFSLDVYDDWQNPSKPLPPGWSYFLKLPANLQVGGYYAESFIECETIPVANVQICSIVIVHRGTVRALWKNRYEDFLIFFNLIPDYFANALAYIDQVQQAAKAQYPQASLMYYQTGHSLGALIAELTTGSTAFDGVNSLVFDSPGAVNIIQKMIEKKILPTSALTMTALWTGYDFSGPNLINTTNPQVKPPSDDQIGNYEFTHEDFAQSKLPLDTMGSPGLLYCWSGYTLSQHEINNFYNRWNRSSLTGYGSNASWPSGMQEEYNYYASYKSKPRFDYWNSMVDYLWQYNQDIHKTYQSKQDFLTHFIAELPSTTEVDQLTRNITLTNNNDNAIVFDESNSKQNIVPASSQKHRTLKEIIYDSYTGQTELLKKIYTSANSDQKLYYAVASDDINLADKLIQQNNANVNYQYGEKQLSLLQVSIMLGYKDVLQLLLKHHANPELRDRDGNTALHTVAKERYEDAKDYAVILIAAGAKPELKNNTGDTPQMVMKRHCPACAKDFLTVLKN